MKAASLSPMGLRLAEAPSSSVCSLNTIAAQSVDVLQASVGVTVGTICWISFVFAQARSRYEGDLAADSPPNESPLGIT